MKCNLSLYATQTRVSKLQTISWMCREKNHEIYYIASCNNISLRDELVEKKKLNKLHLNKFCLLLM